MGILRRLFWRLVPPYEIEATCAVIRAFMKDCPIAPAELGVAALRAARDVEDTVRLIRLEHHAVEYVGLVYVLSTARLMLASGQWHIYRGVLSGEGQALFQAWARCVAALRVRGHFDDQDVETHRAEMSADLRRAG